MDCSGKQRASTQLTGLRRSVHRHELSLVRCNGSEMPLSVSSGLVRLRLVTAIMETLRNGFHGMFPFRLTLWSIRLLLLCNQLLYSSMGASAASVAVTVTGCRVSEECYSEQLFEDCRSRGATESALCFCSNGLPRACRDVCDSDLPGVCPSQCQGYFSCKSSNDPAADKGLQLGWPVFVAITVAVAAAVAGLVLAYRQRENLRLLCFARSPPTGEPEGDNDRPVPGGGVQEEAVHCSQETCPPGDQTSDAVVRPAPSSTEPEVTALLSNS